MRKRVPGIIALFVVGLSMSSGPAAFADRSDNSRDYDWRDSGNRRSHSRGGAWNSWDTRDRRDRDRERRSYYYEDPYCGTRSSHISDFKQHYGRAHHASMILKVDIRSGCVTDRYRYDRNQEEWRDWDRRSRSDHDHRDDDRDRRRSSRSRDRDDRD